MFKPQARISERWSRDWARPDYAPGWRIAEIPAEVQAALDDGWLPSDDAPRLLDLGCGDGVVTAHLAAVGINALGVDVAERAIALARERIDATVVTSGALAFEVADATESLAHFGMFDAVLDRGCFHNVTKRSQRLYVEALAEVLPPGAPMLLVCHTRNSSAAERVKEVTAAFAPAFEVHSTEEMRIADRIPGVALRLRRAG